MQAWRVAHPPVRGHALCGTQPLVHVGFMKAWLAGGFNEKVINHIMQLVNCPRAESMKIYVTGQIHLCVLLSFLRWPSMMTSNSLFEVRREQRLPCSSVYNIHWVVAFVCTAWHSLFGITKNLCVHMSITLLS